MNILVTGCKGQLGSEIKRLSADSYQPSANRFIFTDVDELDITDYSALEGFVKKLSAEGCQLSSIINCAAYTAVDKAESEKELAVKINEMACSNLAKICSKEGIFLIHMSTDYVFDGNNYKPYTETDITNPLSAYGRTKLEGESQIIKEYQVSSIKYQDKILKTKDLRLKTTGAIIIRTSWLYSSFGNNFVKSILKNAKERGKLNVVYDQVGSPTYARDLAKAILKIIDTRHKTQDTRQVEVYNYSNEGVCSWYDFAKAIVEMKNIPCIINPIETKDYPTPTKRPHYSVFSKDKIKNDFGIDIPYWRDSLKECLKLVDS